jgi:hypothetical protein
LQTYQFEYYYCELRREIIALGLADRVTLWTGFPPEAVLQETIARHDVSILYYTPTFPSFAASACLRTAFSAARPVIVSECHHFDGPPDTEAAMIRVGSVPQMGEAIGRLFDDADYYREMARRARQCALRRPHAAVAADYVRVFEAVAGGARREPPRGSEPGLARPVLGVALLTAGEPERLRRALQSISETSEGMPVIVVDSREQSEAGALMRDEFASVPYVRLAGGEPLQALATAATVMNVRYLQLLEDRQVLLPGWQEDLLAAVRSGVGVVTCAAVHNGAVGGLEVRREVESLSQLCVGREALWTVTAAEFHPGAAAWRKEAARPPAGPGPELLARLREGGYTVHPLNRALVAEG